MAIVKIYDDNNNSTSSTRGMLQTYDNDIICYLRLDIKEVWYFYNVNFIRFNSFWKCPSTENILQVLRHKIKIKSQFFYCEYENIPTVSKRVNKICKVWIIVMIHKLHP